MRHMPRTLRIEHPGAIHHESNRGNWYTHNCYHADGNGNITYLVNTNQTLVLKTKHWWRPCKKS